MKCFLETMRICVFCSSSDFVDQHYFDEARALGNLISNNNFELIYGGTKVGLMGALAQSVKEGDGQITGVIPQLIHQKGIAFEGVDSLIVTRDLRERKAVMEDLADAFVALPGGFGTLEELLEMITLKQLQVHQKPIVLINTNGFFNSLITFFDHVYYERFASERYRGLLYFSDNAWDAINYIRNYRPGSLGNKWSK